MAFQLIPLATVQNDLDIIWPNTQIAHNVGDAFDGSALIRYGQNNVNPIFGARIGGGTVNMALDPRQGFIAQITSVPLGQAAAFNTDGIQFRPVLHIGGPSAIYQLPQWSRVFRFQCVFQLQAPIASSNGRSTFIGFIPNGGAGPDAVGNSYFGIILSTAGRWQWVTRAGGGGFGFSDQVDLFAAVTTPHTIDIVILEANGQRNAICQLFLDGAYNAPFLARPWIAGGVLPDYTSTVVNATAWITRLQANDVGIATVLQVLKCRWMIGQYTPAGSPL